MIGGNLTGRYTLNVAGKVKCFACRVQSLSPFAVALAAPAVDAVEQETKVYLPDVGLLLAKVALILDFGFTAEIEMTDVERVKLARKIRWLKRRNLDHTLDKRTHKRFLPRNPRSTLMLADGIVHRCFIIDISCSGVAVSADLDLAIGQPVAVGRIVGRVVRQMDAGFAIQFTEERTGDEVEGLLAPGAPAADTLAPA